MQNIDAKIQIRIIDLWNKGCPLDILCDEVDIDPEILAEFLRAKGFIV